MANKGQKKSDRASGRPAPTVTARPAADAARSMDIWEWITWICLHLLVLLVPVAMTNLGPFSPGGVPLTYDQFDIVKVVIERGLMLLAFGSWLIGLALRGGKVRLAKGQWLLLVFIGWILLTTVLSVHVPTAVFGKYRRFEGLISFVTYAVTFFVALQVVDSAARLRSLARTLAIGGFLVVWYGVIQVVGSVPLGIARVLQPTSVALALVVPIGLLYLAMRARDDGQARLAYAIGAAIALFGGILFAAGMAQNVKDALAQGLQSVSIDPVRWGQLPFESNRAFSTFGNPDLLGGYLIFPWAVTLGLALSEKHSLWRVIYWSLSLLTVFVGITSYVRGAWIGATVSLVLVAVAYVRTKAGTEMRLNETDWTFIGGAIVVAASVIVASSLRPDVVRNVLTRVVSIFQFNQGSAQTRFQIWEAARAAVAQRPIFGWGPDTFRLLFPMFKPAAYVEAAGYLSVADNVHNYPLQLATGIGIPGALLFYGLIGGALAMSARTALAKGGAGKNLVLAGFWAAVVGYVVHLLFGLSVTGSTIFMWLSLGVLLGPVSSSIEVKPASWGVWAAALVIVAIVLGSFFNTRYIVADMHYLRGRVLSEGYDRVSEIQRAIDLNPYNDMYRLELGTAWRLLFRASAEEYARTRQSGKDDQELRAQTVDLHDRAERSYKDTIAYVPLEYDTYVFLANLENEAAVYLDPAYAERAVEVAKQGIKVEKYGPAIRVQLANALLFQGKVNEALEHLGVAARLDPHYSQAHIMLAQAYVRAGRTNDAIAALKAYLQLNPADTAAATELTSIEASAPR